MRVIEKILRTQSAGTEDLKAFGCAMTHIADVGQRLRNVFRISSNPVAAEDRLNSAEKILDEAHFLQSSLESLLFNFAQAPLHIADEVSVLRRSLRDFADLIEEKKEQRDLILDRLTP
jgi:hypothetical protein